MHQPLQESPLGELESRSAEPIKALDPFLRSVEGRALALARYNVGNVDDALDIVQDAMIKLSTRYASKPAAEWPALFFRILSSTITDWHRKQTLKRTWFWIAGRTQNEDDDEDTNNPLTQAQALPSTQPDQQHQQQGAMSALDVALQTLPQRQRQVFLLRAWEQLDTKASANALGISEGSVKTHYSRALITLRETLGAHWP